MKIKSEPQDGPSHGTGGTGSDKSAAKNQSKPPKQEATVRVKTEPTDRPIKQEPADRKCSPVKPVKKESPDKSVDLTTHVVKSEVKLEPAAESSSSTTKKRTSKKKRVTRRKTTKRKTTKKKTAKKGGRKKVRKTKVMRSSRGVMSNVRSRLAAKIGMTKKKVLGPHSLPLINKPSYERPPVRSEVIPPLSLLGHGLPAFPVTDDVEEVPDFGGETAVASRRSLFTNARLSDLKAGLMPDPLEEIRLNSDLLGSILETQEILLASSQHVSVTANGTLRLNSTVPIRRHTSTTDAGEGKACKSPPASDPNSHENGNQGNNHHVDLDPGNQATNPTSFSSGKEQENVTHIRIPVPSCGMPLKKRKFESHDLKENAEAKLPAIENLNLTDPKKEPVPSREALTKVEPQEHVTSDQVAAEVAAQLKATIVSPRNECGDEKKSIERKLESGMGKGGKEEAGSDGKEGGRAEERKVKRCRHGKIVKDKSSKETPKSENHPDGSRKEEHRSEKKHDSSEMIPKSSGGADEAKRRIVVRSEVRDKKLNEKSRSEDREKSHSRRTNKKKSEDVWTESSDRRSHYSRDEVEWDRSRSSRRARSREQSPGRRTSRHEEEKPIRKSDHKFQGHGNEMEQERSRKHRHHHRMNPRQHKDEGKTVVKESGSERNPRVDANHASEAKTIHTKSKAYDKAAGDSVRHVSKDLRTQTRRMSGPKTPPDVRMKSLTSSNKSPPTPTMDETDSPATGTVNGSTHQQHVSRRPIPPRGGGGGGKDTKDFLQSDPPLFASPTKVANPSSWLKQFSRPDNGSRATSSSSSHPSHTSAPSQAEAEKELDSGTNQIAIQQFLQSMLPKSKSMESPVSDAAYSPSGPLIASPVRDELTGSTSSLPSGANQSIIDQILKFAQAQQNASNASKNDSNPEEKQKTRASVRKLVSADGPASADDVHLKEKYLDKLNRQERVVEEVKLVLKPFYQRREVTKFEYKEIMRKAVPKVCHNKTQEINPSKIKGLVEKYIRQVKADRKKSSNGP